MILLKLVILLNLMILVNRVILVNLVILDNLEIVVNMVIMVTSMILVNLVIQCKSYLGNAQIKWVTFQLGLPLFPHTHIRMNLNYSQIYHDSPLSGTDKHKQGKEMWYIYLSNLHVLFASLQCTAMHSKALHKYTIYTNKNQTNLLSLLYT